MATATLPARGADEAPVAPDMTTPFKRKDKVVAAVDMPGIPAGTAGKVTFVAGFDWVRYWVRFENGVTRGSINRAKLVRPGEPFGPALVEALAAAAAPVAAAASGEAEAGGGGGEGHLHAGVLVPAHLLERSKKRREVLGA